MLRFLAALIAIFSLLSPAAAQDKRVALVIGNSDYKNVFSIKNPLNDALDVSLALSRMGFSVTTVVNATAQDLRRSLGTFGNKASVADVAVLFYAGHALQSDGVYWVLPVDGQANSLADIARTSLSLPQILEQIDGARRLTAVFLDTARNDPFNEAAKGNLPSGLVKQTEDPKDMLISFATGAGRTVADGEDRNSPFTAALLKHIAEPGIELTRLMNQIRADVTKATANQQIPSFYMTAADDVYFVPPVVKAAVPQAVQPKVEKANIPEKPAEIVKAPEKPGESFSSPEKPAEPVAAPEKQAEAVSAPEKQAEAVSAPEKPSDSAEAVDKPREEEKKAE